MTVFSCRCAVGHTALAHICWDAPTRLLLKAFVSCAYLCSPSVARANDSMVMCCSTRSRRSVSCTRARSRRPSSSMSGGRCTAPSFSAACFCKCSKVC